MIRKRRCIRYNVQSIISEVKMNPYVFIYGLINAISFILFDCDKRKARKGGWRIKERTLLLACTLFGAFGGLLAMLRLRHKTHKPAFMIGVPALLLIQWIVLYYFRDYWM